MLDEKGFKRKRFDDIFAEIQDKAKETLGDKVNTSERSPLGIILRIFAWFLAVVWMLAEKVYYSAYVNTAEGTSLDRLGPYVGVSRTLAQAATGTVTLTGTPGYTVPAGFLVGTEADVYFETTADVTLDGGGKGSVAIEAMEAGLSGNVAAGEIRVIVNPNPDVTDVTNPEATNGGREKQTDPEFRDLFSASVASGGAATVDAITAALLAVRGVRAATVIENLSLTPDVAGRPGRSFEAYVLGGASQDIGDAIFDVKAAGIESYGSVAVNVKDIGGNPHVVKYSPAEVVPVHIRVVVYKTPSYPADGDDLIKSTLVQSIGGEDKDGTVYAGLTMGEDVVMMKLAATLYNVPGVEDLTLQLSTDGTDYSGQNIKIAVHQVAQTAAAWIEVTDHDFTD